MAGGAPFLSPSLYPESGCPILRVVKGGKVAGCSSCGPLRIDAKIFGQVVAAPRSCPVRFNLYAARQPRCVVPETRPHPVLRLFNQPPQYRIAVHVAQLFDSLLFAPNVEVIVPPLPERFAAAALQPARSALLEHLQRHRHRRSAGFAQQQMHVLRHHHVTGNRKLIPQANALQFLLKDGSCPRRAQFRLPPITTEGDEMKRTALLVPNKPAGHGAEILQLAPAIPTLRAQDARRMGHPHLLQKKEWVRHSPQTRKRPQLIQSRLGLRCPRSFHRRHSSANRSSSI